MISAGGVYWRRYSCRLCGAVPGAPCVDTWQGGEIELTHREREPLPGSNVTAAERADRATLSAFLDSLIGGR